MPLVRMDTWDGRPSFPSSLLPGPQDPNDLLASDAVGTATLKNYFSAGRMLARGDGTAAFEPGAVAQFELSVRPGVFYDTGFAGGNSAFRPSVIALPGTPEAHQRGQFYFDGTVPGTDTGTLAQIPLRAQLGGQTMDMFGMGNIQATADILSTGNNFFNARSAYAAAVTPNNAAGVLFGKAETLFGDQGSSPFLVGTGSLPLGAVALSGADGEFTNVAQFRLNRAWHNVFSTGDAFVASMSIEDQSSLGDVLVASSDDRAVLHRYPVLVARARLQGANGFNSFQVASLVRSIGYNDVDFRNHFVTGWGVSTIGRMKLGNRNDADSAYFTVVGGEGIGGYIYSGTDGAVTTANSIRALSNLGSFVGYRHVWAYTSPTRYLSSNCLYGYAWGSNQNATEFAVTSVNQNRILYEAGCNLIWNRDKNFAIGIEYLYGSRVTSPVSGGLHGEDHRVMFVLNAASGSSDKTSAGRGGRSSRDGGPGRGTSSNTTNAFRL